MKAGYGAGKGSCTNLYTDESLSLYDGGSNDPLTLSSKPDASMVRPDNKPTQGL